MNKSRFSFVSFLPVPIVLFIGGFTLFACALILPQMNNYAQIQAEFSLVVVDSQGPDGIWQKTIGDINGDGLLDLIAGGINAGGLVWYENPTWSKHTIDTGGGFSTDAEVVDVDMDGDNDVVSLSYEELRWYENPGWQVHPVDSRVLHDIEAADFDDDGDVDLVARNQGDVGDELHFYQQISPTSWQHRSISCAEGEGLKVDDIDRDGDLDVIINASWFENTGDIINGAWTEYTYTVEWSHSNTFVSTGDINGDGWVDIVLAPSEAQGGTYRISWFEAPLNPKDLNWTEHIVDNNVETVHHFVGTGDFDNDGDYDIAAAEMEQGDDPDEIKIYENGDGIGTTWSKQVIATTGSHSMRVLDFDLDGDEDLYGANWQGSQVELYENHSCLNLDTWKRYEVDASRPWRAIFITTADIDGDGNKDIITGGWWYKNPGSPGGIWNRKVIGSPLNNMAAVYDFDEDGFVDVLGTMGQGADADPRFVWARNNGTGTFSIYENIPAGGGDFLQGVAVGNIMEDNSLGVALSWHSQGIGIQRLSVPADPVIDNWTIETLSPISQDEALSMEDIDQDGDNDLLLGTIWLENQGTVWIDHLLHDTSGLPYGETDPDRNRLADMNRDGRLDAVVGYEAISVLGKLAWYGQGTDASAAWQEHVIQTVVGPMSLDVVDMDDDGDFDVVVGEHNLSDPASASLYVMENIDGLGSQWGTHLVYTGDEHHDGAQTGDMDGDADLDIVSIGWDHDNVLLYENVGTNCNPQPSPTQTTTGLPSATATVTGTPLPSSTPGPYNKIYFPAVLR